MMNGTIKHKSNMRSAAILSLSAAVIATCALGYQSMAQDDTTAACVCESNATYNTSLPSNHPNNRCAAKSDLSWKTWLTGSQNSSQFHFVDLVELLSGHQNRPIDDMPSTNPQSQF